MRTGLLRGGGRAARLEALLPAGAACLITFVLLVLLSLQHGLGERSERTAWRTPDRATVQAVAEQAGYTDYVAGRPLAIVELTPLDSDPPPVPGVGRFPTTGELWVSPALLALLRELPADQLADRFRVPVAAMLPATALEHPDELLAVRGGSVGAERPPHLWDVTASFGPVRIDRWSTSPDLYRTTYEDAALLAIVLAALPLAAFAGLSARLLSTRRRRRLAILRLLGCGRARLVRTAAIELALLAGAGAVVGALLHALTLPLTTQVAIRGGPWYPADVALGLPVVLATAAGTVAALTAGALLGLVPVLRDPVATSRRAGVEDLRTRRWTPAFVVAAVALFWTQSSNAFVTGAFSAVLLLGWGLLSLGPWLVRSAGRLLARSARGPASLLAGRRLADAPGAAWRTVAGLALAAFLGGFVAVSLPSGLGGTTGLGVDAPRLDAVVAADRVGAATASAQQALARAGSDAQVRRAAAPFWLDDGDWTTLQVASDGSQAQADRLRTALQLGGGWGPELQLAEVEPNRRLVLDGVRIGLLVMPLAALVALLSAVVGTLSRMAAQHESLLALRRIGVPEATLLAAQRRELVLPASAATVAGALGGMLSASTLGSVSPAHPVALGVLLTLALLAVGTLRLTDGALRHALARTIVETRLGGDSWRAGR